MVYLSSCGRFKGQAWRASMIDSVLIPARPLQVKKRGEDKSLKKPRFTLQEYRRKHEALLEELRLYGNAAEVGRRLGISVRTRHSRNVLATPISRPLIRLRLGRNREPNFWPPEIRSARLSLCRASSCCSFFHSGRRDRRMPHAEIRHQKPLEDWQIEEAIRRARRGHRSVFGDHGATSKGQARQQARLSAHVQCFLPRHATLANGTQHISHSWNEEAKQTWSARPAGTANVSCE